MGKPSRRLAASTLDRGHLHFRTIRGAIVSWLQRAPPPRSAARWHLFICSNLCAPCTTLPITPRPPARPRYIDVIDPATNTVCGSCAASGAADVEAAVAAASAAFPAWSGLTIKKRAAIMFKLHALIAQHADELADLVVLENGKNKGEALASVAKGNETVEWACSLPQLAQGKHLKVSNGIHCHEVVEPLGVVASIVPFNFPIMVPLWTVPIALTMGNCVILKPSEKCPFTFARTVQLFHAAGVPPGVFQVVHGAVDAVLGLCDHPKVEALTFVGSSRVAKLVAARCHGHHKRCLALGGAKNHLVAVRDCDVDMASSDITSSFAGCAGQRCMAASALVTVGEQPALLDAVVAKAGALAPGQAAGKTVGPVVDKASHARILGYIDAAAAEGSGAKILLDGRAWARPDAALLARFPHLKEGNWVGPTVILHANRADPALHDEIFGPVLSVVVARDREDAVAIENASPFGNAAAIYTSTAGQLFSQTRTGPLAP